MLQHQLKKIIISATLSLPIFALNVPKVLAEHYLDFKVNNNTSFTIVRLYVSNSGHRSWEEDVLGQKVIPPGNSGWVEFEGNHDGCLYDLRAEFNDSDVVEDYQVNLCEGSEYTFHE